MKKLFSIFMVLTMSISACAYAAFAEAIIAYDIKDSLWKATGHMIATDELASIETGQAPQMIPAIAGVYPGAEHGGPPHITEYAIPSCLARTERLPPMIIDRTLGRIMKNGLFAGKRFTGTTGGRKSGFYFAAGKMRGIREPAKPLNGPPWLDDS